jgi:hypothetical protein
LLIAFSQQANETLIAPALEIRKWPNNCIISVTPPSVLSASSLVAAFPSNIPSTSSEQPSQEVYSLLEMERYLNVLDLLSYSSSAMNASTPIFANSKTFVTVSICV